MGIRFNNAGDSFEVRDRYGRDGAGLTAVQRHALVTFAELRVELGIAPSVRQVCDRLSIALGAHIWALVIKLESLGYLQHQKGMGRTLQLTDLGWRISGVDSCGIADPRVERPHHCPRCAAFTFMPHKPETCRQLLTGRTFAEQESA